MQERTGIYLVETPAGRRVVVIAASAERAVSRAVDGFANEAGIDASTFDSTAYVVGRLGTFDPGIEGARLVGAGSSVLVAGGLAVGEYDLSDPTERELARLADPSDDEPETDSDREARLVAEGDAIADRYYAERE